MQPYTKLFHSILHSTVWNESLEVKVLWITMLAMCNKDGEVSAAVPGLARTAGLSIQQTLDGLKKFMGPDQYSRTKDFEGRRIEEIDGGWRLLNHAKYRALMSADERREYEKLKKREQRSKKSLTVGDLSGTVPRVHKVNDKSPLSTHTDVDVNTDTETKALKTTTTACGNPSKIVFNDEQLAGQVYDHHPKKVSRSKAIEYIVKRLKTLKTYEEKCVERDRLVAHVKLYAACDRVKNGYVLDASTFFHTHMDDDPEAWKSREPIRSDRKTNPGGYVNDEYAEALRRAEQNVPTYSPDGDPPVFDGPTDFIESEAELPAPDPDADSLADVPAWRNGDG